MERVVTPRVAVTKTRNGLSPITSPTTIAYLPSKEGISDSK
jgi:hypothetical protein